MRNFPPHLAPPAVPLTWQTMPVQSRCDAFRFLDRLLKRLEAQGLPVYTSTEEVPQP